MFEAFLLSQGENYHPSRGKSSEAFHLPQGCSSHAPARSSASHSGFGQPGASQVPAARPVPSPSALNPSAWASRRALPPAPQMWAQPQLAKGRKGRRARPRSGCCWVLAGSCSSKLTSPELFFPNEKPPRVFRLGITGWFGLEGTLKITWFQAPCHEQEHLSPAQGAQSSIQPGLERCQGGGTQRNPRRRGHGPGRRSQLRLHLQPLRSTAVPHARCWDSGLVSTGGSPGRGHRAATSLFRAQFPRRPFRALRSHASRRSAAALPVQSAPFPPPPLPSPSTGLLN